MKILLVCPPYKFEGYTPTGLASIAAVAEKLGHQVKIIDMNVQKLQFRTVPFIRNDPNGYPQMSWVDIGRVVPDWDLVGITGMSFWKDSIIPVVKLFKEVGLPVILGGHWATLMQLDALRQSGADYVCVGEGEDTFAEFLQRYPDPTGIRGIGYRKGDVFVMNAPRPFEKDLNKYPRPAWHLLDLKKYKRAAIETSRGCPYECIFCALYIYNGRPWRSRSVESVIAEMKELDGMGVSRITFGDANLTMSMSRFDRLCDAIKEAKLSVKLDAVQGVRADRLTFEILKKMKEVGFVEVIIAPETGSQRVADEIIMKHLDLKLVVPIAEECKRIGLKLGAFFVIGFPWETMEEIIETRRMAAMLRELGCSAYVGNAMPLLGTKLYRQAKEEGYLRFDGEELERNMKRDRWPRTTHCLTSPNWKPEDIEAICLEENRLNVRSAYLHPEKILKAFLHPVKAVRKTMEMLR